MKMKYRRPALFKALRHWRGVLMARRADQLAITRHKRLLRAAFEALWANVISRMRANKRKVVKFIAHRMRVLLWKWQQHTMNQSIEDTRKVLWFQTTRRKQLVFNVLKAALSNR